MVIGLLLKLLISVLTGFGSVIGRNLAQDLENWRARRDHERKARQELKNSRIA